MKRDFARFFSVEDFRHPADELDAEYWEQQKQHFQYIADLANKLLLEHLKTLPDVYTNEQRMWFHKWHPSEVKPKLVGKVVAIESFDVVDPDKP